MVTATSSRTAKVTLPNDTQIQIVREFNAPRRLVFKTWTTPELIRRWWHANRGKVTAIEVDLRVGGKWRYAMIANGGFEVAFHGEYREIVPDERIVCTEIYEGAPDSGGLTTLTLVEDNGHTRATILMQLKNKADRDAVLESGMEDGLQDALDLVEQVAATLA